MSAHRKLMVRELLTGVAVALVTSLVLGGTGVVVTLELVKAKNEEQDKAIASNAAALTASDATFQTLKRDIDSYKDRVAEKLDLIGRDIAYIRGRIERTPAIIER